MDNVDNERDGRASQALHAGLLVLNAGATVDAAVPSTEQARPFFAHADHFSLPVADPMPAPKCGVRASPANHIFS